MAQTLTVQSVVNLATIHTELMPLAGVGGFANEPALSLANDVLSELLMGGGMLFGDKFGPFPWKCNQVEYPTLLVTSYGKNDYLWAGASAFTLSGSLTGAAIDLASNSAITEAAGTVTVKVLEPFNANVGETVYMTGNSNSVYNSTFSAGPQQSQWSNGWTILSIAANKLSFTFATGSGQSGVTSGAPGITDFGWLESFSSVQMTDISYPQSIRYGLGVRTLTPFARVGTYPVRMALVKDLGTGVLKFRLNPLPGNTPLGVTIVYQKQAPILTSLSATWGPFPDDYNAMIRQCFLARAYRFVESKRSETEIQKAESLILAARGRDDAEESDEHIVPDSGLMDWQTTGAGGWWL